MELFYGENLRPSAPKTGSTRQPASPSDTATRGKRIRGAKQPRWVAGRPQEGACAMPRYFLPGDEQGAATHCAGQRIDYEGSLVSSLQRRGASRALPPKSSTWTPATTTPWRSCSPAALPSWTSWP